MRPVTTVERDGELDELWDVRETNLKAVRGIGFYLDWNGKLIFLFHGFEQRNDNLPNC